MTNNHKIHSLQDIKLKIEQYCVYQDRCQYEVEQKLKPYNLNNEEIDIIIKDLINQKFLNEVRYVQSYTRGSYRYKKWGWNKIKANLLAKHIARPHIDKGYLEIDQNEYKEIIYTELLKKWPNVKAKSDFEKKNKLIRFGTGRGYEYDIINAFLETLNI